MAGSFKIRLYLLIPVSEIWIGIVASVALFEVAKAKHRCHKPLPVAVHSRNSDKIPGVVVIFTDFSKKNMLKIIISMHQKAVVYNSVVLNRKLL